MTKAFESAAFLDSPAARPLRILAEYLEPSARLQDQGIRRAITFWGSARISPGPGRVADGRDYYSLAHALAARLAAWTVAVHSPVERFHILTGAGAGIMEAAHAGAATVDPTRNVGLNIQLPFEQRANPYIADARLFEFHYFFTRKYWFLKLSSALVVFPGGFGTLDELFEILTLIQTGKAARRPVLLFGREFWDDLIDFPGLVRQGLISPADLDGLLYADSVEEAFAQLTEALLPTPDHSRGPGESPVGDLPPTAP